MSRKLEIYKNKVRMTNPPLTPSPLLCPMSECGDECYTNCAWFRIEIGSRMIHETIETEVRTCFCGDKEIGELT